MIVRHCSALNQVQQSIKFVANWLYKVIKCKLRILILGEDMHKKFRIIILLPLLIYLYGCEPGKSIPIPTLSMTTMPTEIPRWVLYENALSKAILRSEGGLCEWMIYGVSDSKKEVYMWAFCHSQAAWGRGGAGPAVIYLEDNGDIANVVIPRDGNYYPEDVRVLFPPDIQVEIFSGDFTFFAQ